MEVVVTLLKVATMLVSDIDKSTEMVDGIIACIPIKSFRNGIPSFRCSRGISYQQNEVSMN